ARVVVRQRSGKRQSKQCVDQIPQRNTRNRMTSIAQPKFMESDRAAGLSQLRSDPQKGCWISLVNQDIATDHKVKSTLVHECIGYCFAKGEMLESASSTSLSCYRQDLRIQINSDHGTRGADQFSCQHGNVTCSSAQIQNAHARLDSSASEKTLSDR